jgi:hypothetical protein
MCQPFLAAENNDDPTMWVMSRVLFYLPATVLECSRRGPARLDNPFSKNPMKIYCQICQRETDNPSHCHPECLQDYLLELDSLNTEALAAPFTGEVCRCGALLTVQDHASSSPRSCLSCRLEADRAWLESRDHSFHFNQ